MSGSHDEYMERLLRLEGLLVSDGGDTTDRLMQELRDWYRQYGAPEADGSTQTSDGSTDGSTLEAQALTVAAAKPAAPGGNGGGGGGGGGKGGGGGSKGPTAMALDTNTVEENSPGGTIVGTLTTTDASKKDTHTYEITNDPLSLFAINGDQLVVADGAEIDYESLVDPIVSVEITVTDKDGNTFTQIFEIEVLDVDEGPANTAPTDILLSNSSVNEHAFSGTVVGQFSNDDPDAGDTHTYTLVDDFGGAFRIEGDQLVVNDPSLLDFETSPTIDVIVEVSDGTASYQEMFTITLIDVNEPPTDIVLSNDTIAENSGAGTPIGQLSNDDPDAADTYTYSLINSYGGTFAIIDDQLVVNDPSLLDFESTPTMDVVVEVSDGSSTYQQTLTVNLTDVNEAPTSVALSNDTIDENTANDTVVGQLSNDDPDAGDIQTYTLVDDFNGAFRIEGDQLIVNDASLLDFEVNPTIDVIVEVTDGAFSHQETITINLTDVPESNNPYYVDALLAGDQYRWNYGSAAGTGVTITYSFMTEIPDYYDFTNPDILDVTNFMAFTAAMIDAAESALAGIARFANITFEYVASVDDADIAFGSHQMDLGIGGYTYYPEVELDEFGNPVTDENGNYVYNPVGGDVWITSSFSSPAAGQIDYLTFIHEIGHALGLQHPGDYDGLSGGTGESFLPVDEDNRMYTVMSYTTHPDWQFGTEPQTMMTYDIAALQYLYGANMDFRTEDNVYGFGSLNNVIGTVWDAGGYDTFDATGETHDVTINLNEGAYSSIGSDTEFILDIPAVNNIGIAFGTEIEAAIGGSGDDLLIGNGLDNFLSGADGADWFVGGDGDDTIDGGAGADVFFYGDNESGNDTITGFEDGVDTLDFSFSDYQYDDLTISDVAGDTLIEFATGSITIAGVSSDQIDENDFVFGDLIA